MSGLSELSGLSEQSGRNEPGGQKGQKFQVERPAERRQLARTGPAEPIARTYRAGFVGIIGLPNAGKSTLLNALVGEKVAIVTAKPQTTRQRVVGIMTAPEGQIVLVDAPGIVGPSGSLNRFLRAEYEDVMRNADLVCVLLPLDAKDAKSIQRVIEVVEKSGKPWLAIISKDDQLEHSHRVGIIHGLLADKARVISVSAERSPQECREKFWAEVLPRLPESPAPLYNDDLYTTHHMRELAAEIVREKCFMLLKQEVPYGLAVRIKTFREEGPLPRIEAEIVVAKENYRAIVVGKQGSMLREIGTLARKDLEELIGRKIYLGLHVSVRKNWTENKRLMKELGYAHSEN